jgi:hypothetical protein
MVNWFLCREKILSTNKLTTMTDTLNIEDDLTGKISDLIVGLKGMSLHGSKIRAIKDFVDAETLTWKTRSEKWSKRCSDLTQLLIKKETELQSLKDRNERLKIDIGVLRIKVLEVCSQTQIDIILSDHETKSK